MPFGPERRGRGHRHVAPRRVDRGARDRRPRGRRCTTPASPWSRSRCSAARRGCSSCCSRRSPSARSRPRSSGSPGCSHARGRRGPRLRARGERRDGERRARPHPDGPALPRRVQGPRARRRRGPRARTTRGARRAATTRRRRSCSPRPSSTSTRSRACPTRGATGWRSSAPSSRRSGSSAVRCREFLGEVIRRIGIVDELEADVDRARRPALAQPRGVPRPGARVRAGRGRAHPSGVPRLRRRGRGAREGRVGARCSRATPTR